MMKSMQIDDLLDRAHVVSLPLAVRFRGITTREALLIEGPAGWGEFAPFLEYGPAESARWLAAGIEAAFEGFPEPVREWVEVNGTIPAVPAEQVPEVMARYPGCRTFKIKVAEKGQTLADDVARVRAVRAHIEAQGRVPVLRVDANGGWSVEEAVAAAKELMPLDYMEQPCKSVEELAEVRSQLMRAGLFVRVAADESIRKASDPYRVAQLQAADVAVVKPAAGRRAARAGGGHAPAGAPHGHHGGLRAGYVGGYLNGLGCRGRVAADLRRRGCRRHPGRRGPSHGVTV